MADPEFSVRKSAGPPQLAPLIHAKKGETPPANAGLWTEESLAALQRFLRDNYLVQVKASDNMSQLSQLVFNSTNPATTGAAAASTAADVMSKVSLGF